MSAGGFTYWTCSNLLTGTFRSRQGKYERNVAPFRYWMNTVLIALGTILTISYLVHQSLVVVAVNRSGVSEPKLENKSDMATPRMPSD